MNTVYLLVKQIDRSNWNQTSLPTGKNVPADVITKTKWFLNCVMSVMSFLIRKIKISKWKQTNVLTGKDVSADAITQCLRTKQNSFSVWRIETESRIEEAVLAIASGQDHLETFYVVMLNLEYLAEKKIDCEKTAGLTPVADLKGTHYNLSNLTYRKLGVIAYHIADKVRAKEAPCYREGPLMDILIKAIRSGRLQLEDLNERVRKKLVERRLATGD